MMRTWSCALVALCAGFAEYNPRVDGPMVSGEKGVLYVLPRPTNASGAASALEQTITKVENAMPGFKAVWIDTQEHKQFVEEELDVPQEVLPVFLASLEASPESRFWYDGFPFVQGLKEWLQDLTDGKEEPLKWIVSAEPKETTRGIVDLTSSNFDEVLEKGSTLIAIVSEWCEHCKSLIPALEAVAEDNIEGLTIARYSFSNNSYCGYQKETGKKQDAPDHIEGAADVGMQQVQKVCWPARLPLKKYKAFEWTSVPTIFWVPGGGQSIAKYPGPRTSTSIRHWVTAAMKAPRELERQASEQRAIEL